MDEEEDVIFVFELLSIELTKVLYPNILYEFTPRIISMNQTHAWVREHLWKILDGHYQKNDKFDTNMETKNFS